MAGLFAFMFALHSFAALLARKPPKDGERYATMAAFVLLLVPALLAQRLPPAVLSLLSLFFAA